MLPLPRHSLESTHMLELLLALDHMVDFIMVVAEDVTFDDPVVDDPVVVDDGAGAGMELAIGKTQIKNSSKTLIGSLH
jgi:hypothetical protein